jgi:hypothetical protein
VDGATVLDDSGGMVDVVVRSVVEVDVLRGGDANLLGPALHPAATSPASAMALNTRTFMLAWVGGWSAAKWQCTLGTQGIHR